ncbi:hypothetical protein RD792_001782 [Penstemon davidsonii]|uniref:Uncharacterized protein n=1 Tax=Penstemon davidsonii TaxID=160366 RepID=A0ABR0DPB5_9LAMI|nr:hypothetical protein RD792_001782 [Penstemon davidsonii]
MTLSKDLIFLILQFCDEENLKRTAHMLEQETGYFFDLKYFEDLVLDGNWEDTEKYLSSFTTVEDNKFSTKIYFEIRKQKYLETLDKHEYGVALDILLKDLKVFSQSNKELFKEMTQLLALDDFRVHSSLSFYGDTLSARKRMMNELKTIIEANPLLQGRTRFPQINKSRLRRLINQSLNWQHLHCENPHPQPHIDTLFIDHKCPGPDSMQDQSNLKSSLPPNPMTESASLFMGNPTSNQSPVNESVFSGIAVNLENMFNKALVESKNSHDTSELTSFEPIHEVASLKEPSSCSANEVPKEFPRTVGRTLNIDSSPSSMDFHPVYQTLLLVGNTVGDIELWDVNSSEHLFKIPFIWDFKLSLNSRVFSEDLENSSSISVNRILWSPDGSLFGVAFSKRMVHLYSYEKNENYSKKKLEIDAHFSSVNDLAFAKPNEKLVAISCGDDKLIQVWDAATGVKQYTFEGHWAPVYSICPHKKENIHFLFSISTSGEIKVWLYDNMGSRVTYDAPGLCCTRMSYNTDGKRLFSCGTNKQGESYIVQWDDSEGFIVRNYDGLSKLSSSMVHFDTSSNRFLAAGDDHLIKIWDVDCDEILAVIDADGGLPASPYIRFNKKGTLLAVSADNNQIKILANDQGTELLQTSGSLTESFEKLALNPAPVPVPVPLKAGVAEGNVTTEEALDALEKVNPKRPSESKKLEMPNISKIVEVPRCLSSLVSSDVETPIQRLVYTNAGNGILALTEDGIHLLWKWVRNYTNFGGEATPKYAPQLWQPKRGVLMINDTPDDSLDDVVTPCLALSRNDSYVISSSGKMISLYNLLVFKKMRNVMPSPPAATCIVFYPPDNNIIAIGMDDSSILIYNIRVDEVISKLQGHSKRISGLAFSTTFNVLVSSGVDTQIVLWDSVTWEKKKSTALQISIGWLASDEVETNIELDKDQKHFLAIHETQLAIYDTTTLRRLKQWAIANFCTRISHAAFSCDSELVYAAMRDGILLILSASDLTPRFEINPYAYLPPDISGYVDPVVVAAHPQKPNQFALGLSSGGVVVIEPLESEERVGFSIAYTAAADAAGVNQASKGMILSTFYYGYACSQVPGGWAAQKIGGRRVLLLSFVLWSLTCAFVPLDPSRVSLLVITRLLVGVAQGFIFPSIHTVLAQWVPPHERSRSVSLTTSGMYFGAAAGTLILPSIVKFRGPQSVFLAEAGLGAMWSLLWFKYASDPPRELLPMRGGQKTKVENGGHSNRTPKIPWKKIILSLPVWAIVVNNFTFHYALYVLMNWLPTYFELGLKFSLQEMGSSKMMPYLNMFIFSNIGGVIADHLITRRILSVTRTRKVLNTVGFVVASFALMALPMFRTPDGVVFCSSAALGFLALGRAGFAVNHMDIAPKYAGIVMGVSNTAGTLAGIVGVDLTGRLLEAAKVAQLDLTSPDSWRLVFLIPGLLCLFSSVVFLLLSTGERVFE